MNKYVFFKHVGKMGIDEMSKFLTVKNSRFFLLFFF